MIRALCLPLALALTLPLVLTTTALAQQQITPDAFLDRADQHTLTFELFPNGGVVGVEQFLSRQRTVWATPDGTCTYGKIEQRGPQVCFIYEDLPTPEHCWVPFDRQGLTVLVSPQMNMQKVTNITTRPVICEDATLS